MVSEVFLTSTPAFGVPTLVGGPTTPPVVLGTTVASVGGGWNIPFAMRFCLSQITNWADLVALFDEARINAVKVYVTYNHNVSTASANSSMPTLFWYPDYTDATVVAPSVLRERMGVTAAEFTSERRTQVMKITPCRVGYELDLTGGAPAAAGVVDGPWISVTPGQNVDHFGIKGYLANVVLPADTPGSPPTSSFRFDIVVDVSFRGLR